MPRWSIENDRFYEPPQSHGAAILIHMAIDPEDYFELSMDELREVARYAVGSAERSAGDLRAGPSRRPRAAIDAARTFANGANRSNLQRVTAAEAHRASKEATIEAAQHAANATGDPAVAAYLHPFVRASQVRHILGV